MTDPDTAQFLAWLKDRLAAAEARGYQRGAAANGCMIVASGEWVAREATPGEALSAWQSKAAGLEVENAKLRAEVKRLRGEVEPSGEDEPKPVDLDDAYEAIDLVVSQRDEARAKIEQLRSENERLRTDLASAEEALRQVDGELTALVEENEKLHDELRRTEYDLALLVTAVRRVTEALDNNGCAADADYDRMAEAANRIAERGAPGWIERALSDETAEPVRREREAERRIDARTLATLDATSEPRSHIEDVRELDETYRRANVGEAGGVAVYPVTAVGALLDEHDRLRARVAELEAERDAAYRRGQEAMRERAARCYDDRAEEHRRHAGDNGLCPRRLKAVDAARSEAARIRALPLDDDASEPSDLVAYIRRHREWSESTLGPGERTEGILAHIRKELDEIAADPRDIEEWADVIILAIDGAWRNGASAEGLAEALAKKQAKNRARQWPDWREVPADRPIEHVRDYAKGDDNGR